jgi:hypothetical protein
MYIQVPKRIFDIRIESHLPSLIFLTCPSNARTYIGKNQ